jgi:hypothetical protein
VRFVVQDEIFVGFNSGISISGDQDQKFKEYNLQGELIHSPEY